MTNSSPIAQDFLTRGRCETCPVVDMHGHYGPFRGIYFPSPYADGMLRAMDRAGVARVVCSSHTSIVDPERGNREMAQVIRDHPDRFLGYRAVNPNYPDQVEAEIARFPHDAGFVGFKFHPSGNSYPLTGDNYLPALEYAHEHRLIVLSHTWGASQYDSPEMLGEVAPKYPDATFIMGHSGYGEWDAAFGVARDNPNVYLDLTAAYKVAGIIERMCSEVGSEKVLFGTDLPWFDPYYCIGCICFSHITDDDRRNILHRTADRLLAPFLTGSQPPEGKQERQGSD
jgi:predicted TIM-barrel fold metal-dependent hydrolase